jgi:hypothetical protein
MFKVILIIVLLVILFQDLKLRSVHWSLFPMVFVCAIFIGIENIEMMQWGFSLLFLVTLMLSLTLYLTIKTGKLVNITNGFFSWGDILFLLAIIPVFDVSSFMLFFTFGTLITLVFHVIAHVIKAQKTIPYAGYMALVSVFYVLFEPTIIYYKSMLI